MAVVNISDLLAKPTLFTKQMLTVAGWVQTNRPGKKIGFLKINDGTSWTDLQLVYKANSKLDFETLSKLRFGAALMVQGQLVLTPQAQQPFELHIETVEYTNNPSESYPLQQKHQTFEFLRQQAPIRLRTKTFFAVARLRSAIIAALHRFFDDQNFFYLTTPIITSNDAEGAGEVFVLTTTNDQNKLVETFFDKRAVLTVSGQLHAEAYAQGLRKVYTLGPTFRAEHSNTPRHAAEFWMLEPEVAFASLDDMLVLSEAMIKTVLKTVLNHYQPELQFLGEQTQTDLISKITASLNASFIRLTYTEAIKLLQQAQNDGVEFVYNDIKWGMDLQSEHEKYLCEHLKTPVFLTDYPADIKAFYMKLNPDQQTVAAFDLLVPGIGELIGGSARENNYELLKARLAAKNIPAEPLSWYLDLRQFGYAPTAGFGLGIERFIMFITGLENIRDVLLFPRAFQQLKF